MEEQGGPVCEDDVVADHLRPSIASDSATENSCDPQTPILVEEISDEYGTRQDQGLGLVEVSANVANEQLDSSGCSGSGQLCAAQEGIKMIVKPSSCAGGSASYRQPVKVCSITSEDFPCAVSNLISQEIDSGPCRKNSACGCGLDHLLETFKCFALEEEIQTDIGSLIRESMLVANNIEAVCDMDILSFNEASTACNYEESAIGCDLSCVLSEEPRPKCGRITLGARTARNSRKSQLTEGSYLDGNKNYSAARSKVLKQRAARHSFLKNNACLRSKVASLKNRYLSRGLRTKRKILKKPEASVSQRSLAFRHCARNMPKPETISCEAPFSHQDGRREKTCTKLLCESESLPDHLELSEVDGRKECQLADTFRRSLPNCTEVPAESSTIKTEDNQPTSSSPAQPQICKTGAKSKKVAKSDQSLLPKLFTVFNSFIQSSQTSNAVPLATVPTNEAWKKILEQAKLKRKK